MPNLDLDLALALGSFRLAAQGSLPLDRITALFGPSGSGKSTLLRAVAGLEPEARGRLAFGSDTWLDSDRGQRVAAHHRQVGLVFQDARLFAHLSVAGNLHYASRRAGPRPGPALDDVVAALDLASLLPRAVPGLSGGERQRVALARTLLARPRLLLMDEPLASLDLARRAELLPYIESLPQRFGVPVLYVTHALDEVARLADQVAVLAAGRLQAIGGTAEVLERLDVAALAGRAEAGVLLEATVTGHDAQYALTSLALGRQQLVVPRLAASAGERVRLRVRARDVALATQRPVGLSIRNILAGRVLEITADPASAHAEVLLAVDGLHLRARLTRASVADLDLAPGREVFALIKSIAMDGDPLQMPL